MHQECLKIFDGPKTSKKAPDQILLKKLIIYYILKTPFKIV